MLVLTPADPHFPQDCTVHNPKHVDSTRRRVKYWPTSNSYGLKRGSKLGVDTYTNNNLSL